MGPRDRTGRESPERGLQSCSELWEDLGHIPEPQTWGTLPQASRSLPRALALHAQLPPWARPGPGLLTHTVQEELALGREAVVDDVVQQRDVQAAGRQVRHDEGGALAVGELGQVDLAGRRVQGTIDVGAAHPLCCQQLLRVKTRGRETGERACRRRAREPSLSGGVRMG